MVYSENDLIVPALKLLKKNPDGLHTSQLIEQLERLLKPTGKDVEFNPSRSDTKFSQKVRNLKSHDTLISKGLATFERHSGRSGGLWRITKEGIKYLGEVEGIIESLERQGFDTDALKEDFKRDLSEIIIEEGELVEVTTIQRKRSRKLRKEAIKKFKREHGGRLVCEVCDFDFVSVYGKLGKGYIIVHHKEPIHSSDIEGTRTTLEIALDKVALLCANCHAIIHRKKGELIPVEELQEIVLDRRS